MEGVCRKFYGSLITPPVEFPAPQIYVVLFVLIREVWNAVFKPRSGKAPCNGTVNAELVKAGGHLLWMILAIRFSHCLVENNILNNCKGSVTFSLQKEAIKKTEKHRPIYLLSHIYKLFTSVITCNCSLVRLFDE